MNRVVFNNYMPNAAQECIAPAAGSSPYMLPGTLLQEEPPEVINFASLEGRGIDLNDPSIELADAGEVNCYVSSVVSGSTGVFAAPVKVVISVKDGYGFAPGLTFHFFRNYCSKLKITAYNGAEVTASGEFAPRQLDFFCKIDIQKFTRIEIELKSTEAPYQLAKLRGINLGKQEKITNFYGDIEIFNEIAVDCNDLPGSTCDFQAEFGELNPTEGQRLTVEHNSEGYGAFSIDALTNLGGGIYAVEAIDDDYRLEDIPLEQAVSGSLTVSEFISLLKSAGIIAESGDIDGSTTMTGTVEADGKTTLRQLAAMVTFATGANLTGAGAEHLRLKKSTETGKVIGASQILGKSKLTQRAPYSQIVVTVGAATATVTNTARRSGQAAAVLTFDKSKLIKDLQATAAEIAARGWQRNEITAKIIASGEKVGDIVKIDVDKQGLKRGVIKSAAYHLRRSSVTADIVIIELPEGGES